MKCLYIILCTVACSNAASKAEEEEKIREQIVHDLGLSRIPDVHKVILVFLPKKISFLNSQTNFKHAKRELCLISNRVSSRIKFRLICYS